MSKRTHMQGMLAAIAVCCLVVLTPASASAATRHEYFAGTLNSWATKTSATKSMIGSRAGGTIGINTTIFAQTVTPYGIYASSEATGGTAEVTHAAGSLQARCFHRPYAGSSTSSPAVVCSYLTP